MKDKFKLGDLVSCCGPSNLLDERGYWDVWYGIVSSEKKEGKYKIYWIKQKKVHLRNGTSYS